MCSWTLLMKRYGLISLDETVWVNQSGIAELFSTSKQVVSYHLGNIFKEGELVQN